MQRELRRLGEGQNIRTVWRLVGGIDMVESEIFFRKQNLWIEEIFRGLLLTYRNKESNHLNVKIIFIIMKFSS